MKIEQMRQGKHNIVKRTQLILVVILSMILCFFGIWYLYWLMDVNGSSWQKELYSPSQITKLSDNYFIVDCWHSRVLESCALEEPIDEWKTAIEISGGDCPKTSESV